MAATSSATPPRVSTPPYPVSAPETETFSSVWKENACIASYDAEQRTTYNQSLKEELIHLSERVDHLSSQVILIALQTIKNKATLSRLKITVPQQIEDQKRKIKSLVKEIKELNFELNDLCEMGQIEGDTLIHQLSEYTNLLYEVQKTHEGTVAKITSFTDQILDLCGESPTPIRPEQKPIRSVERLSIERSATRPSCLDRPYGLITPPNTIRFSMAPETDPTDIPDTEENDSLTHPQVIEGWKPNEQISGVPSHLWLEYNEQIKAVIDKWHFKISDLLAEMDSKNEDLQTICDEITSLQNQLITALTKNEGQLRELRDERDSLKSWISEYTDRITAFRDKMTLEISECKNEIDVVTNHTRHLKDKTKEYFNSLSQELLKTLHLMEKQG